ncbi:ribosomal protein S18-alanine N-acetyltransferase [Clostridium oryzae]|uniref:[Ribosomal protein bS18]-alanine N-acetyltransferase n=1 Tax=Clostridium oryzae TaxID=1450648 RepID=A0A1V4IU87_9CLOT|nr:ribosomal protein S18-alanine N-acetyltransferase [Clostridium oryzae]OPJ63463.1 ribosomal-protein-alanine N-acetyltransferase [Clostridium oryzae]
MDTVEILPINSKHLDGVLAISKLSFATSWSRESFESELTNQHATYFVAVVDGFVAAFGGMWIIVDEAHITNIAVHPEFRSCHIGTKILSALIDKCKMSGIAGMTLEVRTSNYIAQKLYSNFGFQVEGVRKAYYADNKEDALIMWKRDF